MFKYTGIPRSNNIGTNLTQKEEENFVLIIGLASWAGAATFGLLVAVAILAYIALLGGTLGGGRTSQSLSSEQWRR